MATTYIAYKTHTNRLLLLSRLPHGSTVTTDHTDTCARTTVTTPDGATETHTCAPRADDLADLMARLARREELVVCGTVRISSAYGAEEGRLIRRGRRYRCQRAYRRKHMHLGLASGVWQCGGCHTAQRSAEQAAREVRNARRRAARRTART